MGRKRNVQELSEFDKEILENWTESNHYPSKDATRHEWGWQFLRRNHEYQDDWTFAYELLNAGEEDIMLYTSSVPYSRYPNAVKVIEDTTKDAQHPNSQIVQSRMPITHWLFERWRIHFRNGEPALSSLEVINALKPTKCYNPKLNFLSELDERILDLSNYHHKKKIKGSYHENLPVHEGEIGFVFSSEIDLVHQLDYLKELFISNGLIDPKHSKRKTKIISESTSTTYPGLNGEEHYWNSGGPSIDKETTGGFQVNYLREALRISDAERITASTKELNQIELIEEVIYLEEFEYHGKDLKTARRVSKSKTGNLGRTSTQKNSDLATRCANLISKYRKRLKPLIQEPWSTVEQFHFFDPENS